MSFACLSVCFSFLILPFPISSDFLPPSVCSANENTLILQTGGRGFDDKDDADLRAAAAVARASQLAKLRSSTHNLRAQLVAYFTIVVEHDAQTPAWQQARRAVGLQQSATGVPRSALEMQIGW